MRNRFTYRMTLLGLLILLLVVGMVMGFKYSTYDQKASDDSITPVVNTEEEKDTVNIYSDNYNLKKYDIEIVYETHYSLCNEEITETKYEYNTTLEDVLNAEAKLQSENGEKYELSYESKDKVVYVRTINKNCPNHFLVKLENGNVKIYNIVDNTIKTLYRTIEVTQESLRYEMLEELNLGIKANSKEELNFIIEDLES